MYELIDKFAEEVSSIDEYGFGEFKSRVSKRIIHLLTEANGLGFPDIEAKLLEMKNWLDVAPEWDIEANRTKILEEAKVLKELLDGHQQDWESIPPRPARAWFQL